MGRSTLVLPPGDVDNGRQLEHSQEGGGGGYSNATRSRGGLGRGVTRTSGLKNSKLLIGFPSEMK